MPALSRFRVLRVLQLEDCSHLDKNHLKGLGNLYLLRFVRLNGLRVTELPESIGKLESLETLDIRGCHEVIMLPLSFGKLGKLVRLLARGVKLPDGVALENMKSLRELVGICLTLHVMTEIGKLRELKVLKLVSTRSTGDYWNTLIPACLQKLPSLLQVLVLNTSSPLVTIDLVEQVPSGLQTFMGGGHFRAFPRWIDPSLSHLTVLSIILLGVCVLSEHLDKLAQLPSLRLLQLNTSDPQKEQEKLVIHTSASAFPCLTELQIYCDLMFLKFGHGAMRKLQRLRLRFDAIETNKHFGSNNFDYGFENLPSLRHVFIDLSCDCLEAEDAIKKTINDHPNHPSLEIY